MPNLAKRLLSVCRPLASTPAQWRDFVSSLFIQPAIKMSVPREKKVKLPHTVNAETKRCDICGKKPRNPAAICSGPKKILTNIDESL